MLGRLAERLEAQSLTEKSSLDQNQIDELDSGTESDDESSKIKHLQQTMANVFRCSGESRLTRLGKKQLMSQQRQQFNSQLRSSEPFEKSDSMAGSTRSTRRSANNQTRKPMDDEDEENNCPNMSECFEVMVDSGLPSDSDHNVEYHSSEEELEMINCRSRCDNYGSNSTYPIGDVSDDECKSGDEDVISCNKNHCHGSQCKTRSSSIKNANLNNNSSENDSKYCKKREKRKWSDINALKSTNFECDDDDDCADSSSDEEVRDLMVYHLTAPVQFRSSPPADAYKPSRYSVSPPPKFMHISSTQITPFEVCSVSRSSHRKRQRARQRNSSNNMQRSYLDFDKMRQVIEPFILPVQALEHIEFSDLN